MKQDHSLSFMGFHKPLDGYGYATIQIARELKALDPGVQIVDMQDAADANWRDDTVVWKSERPIVALCTPDWLPKIRAPKVIAYTMFETDKLPAGWVDKINTHADQCLVPCHWCAEVFRDNGVTIPIGVVKWGINRADYFPLKRERAVTDGRSHGTAPTGTAPTGTAPTGTAPTGTAPTPYTFLWSGTPDLRKGWDVVYQAFCKAFGHARDVQLIMHFRDPMPVTLKFGDPNVRAVIGLFDRPILREMLREADCFVFPSRGEGWGSPPREAAATGLPVLATLYGGLAEELGYWAYPIGITGKSAAQYGFWEDIGQWVEPNIDHLAARMAYCANNPATVHDFGERAAAWLRTNTPWTRTAQGILEAVC